jgi:hypothetical protein
VKSANADVTSWLPLRRQDATEDGINLEISATSLENSAIPSLRQAQIVQDSAKSCKNEKSF